MSDYCCAVQAHANQDVPVIAIQCDAESSPLQAGTPQPAATATNFGGDTNKANPAEALVLYAMQRVAAEATRYATLLYKTKEESCLHHTELHTAHSFRFQLPNNSGHKIDDVKWSAQRIKVVWVHRKYKPKEAICEDTLRRIPFKQRSDSAATPRGAPFHKNPLASTIRR